MHTGVQRVTLKRSGSKQKVKDVLERSKVSGSREGSHLLRTNFRVLSRLEHRFNSCRAQKTYKSRERVVVSVRKGLRNGTCTSAFSSDMVWTTKETTKLF